MTDGTRLSMTDDGRLAVTKQAATGPELERLHREAEILRRAAHPGVVQLLGELAGDHGVTVHTAFVGGGTLAEHLSTLGVERGARVAATIATTLADLHERGIAHRRLTPDHVLVTDADHVRLCGFADAVLTGDAAPCGADVAAIDVEALAILVRDLAERSPVNAASLHAVAGRVLDVDPMARPSMRTLAQALAAVAGGADDAEPPAAQGRLILPARRSRPVHRPRVSRTRIRLAVLTMVAVVVASVTTVVATRGTSTDPPAPLVAVVPPPPASANPSTTTTPARSSVPTSGDHRQGVRVWPPGPQPDPEVVEVAAGVVSSSGRRWQVASADDLVAVGDWDCDGLATPAVVRHRTGRIWVYNKWAEGSQADLVEAAGTVPDAASARAVDGDGCDDLQVTDVTGQTTRIALDR
ncbi:MAG TPA: protein kinase [Acidimicrobiales bacterium]|nr:protein kinase [Acidimicrobiales bacterium]